MAIQDKDRYVELDIWVSKSKLVINHNYVVELLNDGYSIVSVTLVESYTTMHNDYDDSWEETDYKFKVIMEKRKF